MSGEYMDSISKCQHARSVVPDIPIESTVDIFWFNKMAVMHENASECVETEVP